MIRIDENGPETDLMIQKRGLGGKMRNTKLFSILALLMVFLLAIAGVAYAQGNEDSGADASGNGMGENNTNDSDNDSDNDSGIGSGIGSTVNDAVEQAFSEISSVEIDGETLKIDPSTAPATSPSPEDRIIPGKYMSACVAAVKAKFPETKDEAAKLKCRIALTKAVEQKREQIRERFEAKKGEIKQKIENNSKDIKERLEKNSELRNRIMNISRENAQKLKNVRPEILDKLNKLDNETMAKFAKLDRAKIKEFMNMTPEKLKEKLAKVQINKVKIEDFLNKREVAKEKLDKAKENYKKAQERFNELKEKYQEEKSRFEKSVRDIKTCEKNSNSSKCAELTAKANEHAKAYLNHTINMVSKSLEMIKSKLSENTFIDEDTADAKIAEIDAMLAKADELSDKLKSAMTKEEIQSVAKDVAAFWNSAKIGINENAVELYGDKIENVIKRSDVLQTKLDTILADMESRGIDTAYINTNVELFSLKIEDAKKKYALSEDLLKKASEITGNSSESTKSAVALTKEAHQYLEESKKSLNEAYEIFKTIAKEIKMKGGNLTISANEDIEIATEDSEEAVI